MKRDQVFTITVPAGTNFQTFVHLIFTFKVFFFFILCVCVWGGLFEGLLLRCDLWNLITEEIFNNAMLLTPPFGKRSHSNLIMKLRETDAVRTCAKCEIASTTESEDREV